MFDTNFHKNSGSQILASFIKDNPQKAATILQTVPLSEAVFWLSSLTLQELSKVLNFMDSKKSAVIIRRLPLKQSAKVLLSLNPTIATDILKYVPPFYQKRLESELTQEEKNLLKEASKYPKNSLAFLMTRPILTCKTDTKIDELLQKLKTLPRAKIPYIIYVLDKQNHFAGYIKTAIIATIPLQSSCGSIMEQISTLQIGNSIKEAKEIFIKNNFTKLPLLSKDGFLLGEVSFFNLPNKNHFKLYFIISLIIILFLGVFCLCK